MTSSAMRKKTLGQAIDEVIIALNDLDAELRIIAIRTACGHLSIPLYSLESVRGDGVEIERKFLLRDLPKREILGNGELIKQGYVSVDEPEIRVRSRGGKLYLTIKSTTESNGGLSRREFEVKIPQGAFRKLWEITHGQRIEKMRFTVKHKGLAWEIDEYHGDLTGLYTAEIELANKQQQYTPPDFLEIVAEVTQDDRYKNRSLATKGLPSKSVT